LSDWQLLCLLHPHSGIEKILRPKQTFEFEAPFGAWLEVHTLSFKSATATLSARIKSQSLQIVDRQAASPHPSVCLCCNHSPLLREFNLYKKQMELVCRVCGFSQPALYPQSFSD
jgi:hypothetical protein